MIRAFQASSKCKRKNLRSSICAFSSGRTHSIWKVRPSVLPTPLLCRSDLPLPGIPRLGCIQSYPVNSSQLVFLGRASPKCNVGGRHLASCMQTAVVLDQIRRWHSLKQRKGGKRAASWARLGGHLGGEWLQGPLGMRRGFLSKVSRGGEKAACILTAVSVQARSYRPPSDHDECRC